MISSAAVVASPRRGLSSRTRNWKARVGSIESVRRLRFFDNYMRRAKAGYNWDAVEGEVHIFLAATPAACKEGWRDHLHTATEIGTVHYLPSIGIVADETAINAHISTGVLAEDWPGVTLNGHSLGWFSTRNMPGSYNVIGANGTAGAGALMGRSSSGVRSGVWLASPQLTAGGSVGVGYHFGCRTGPTAAYVIDGEVITDYAMPSTSLPNNPHCFLSAEPGNANSPESLGVGWLGAEMSKDQGMQWCLDTLQLFKDCGIWQRVKADPIVLGPNAFTSSSILDIIPSNLTILRQRPPPASNAVSGASYVGFPFTHTLSRFFKTGNRGGPLDGGLLVANPITTANGSSVLTIEHEDHGLLADRDMMEIAGATPGNGLADGDVNRRFLISVIVDTDHYEVETGGIANADGAIGGAAVRAIYTTFRDEETTFTFPRGGGPNTIVWAARGGTVNRRPNSVEGVPIRRRTDAGYDGLVANIECRPGFTEDDHAILATIIQFGWVGGLLARDDTRITSIVGIERLTGWGYLDIAEFLMLTVFSGVDIDPAKVISCQEAWVRADELFVTAVAGYATSFDWVLLQPGRRSNVPNQPVDKVGITVDMEPANARSPERTTFLCDALSDIAEALEFQWDWLGHAMVNPQAINNGFTQDNVRHIQQRAGLRAANILSIRQADPAAAVAYLNSQLPIFTGPSGTDPVDVEKLMVSYTSATGAAQVPLDQCAAIGARTRELGINKTHWRRAAQFEGGTANHFWQQQHLAYYPNLGVGPPMTGVDQALALQSAVESHGGPSLFTLDRLGLVTDLFSGLINDGLLPLIEMMTIFANESAIAARTDWRTRILGTLNGGLVPVVDRWLLCDGVDDHFDHGWAPNAALTMTGANQMIAVYVLDEVGQGSVYAAGAVNSSATGQALRINPDSAASATAYQITGQAGCELATSAQQNPSTVSGGLYWIAKSGTEQVFGHNDTVISTRTITTSNDMLSTRNIITGGFNNNGTVAGRKAGKRLATFVGAYPGAAGMGQLYSHTKAYFVAIGADVP